MHTPISHTKKTQSNQTIKQPITLCAFPFHSCFTKKNYLTEREIEIVQLIVAGNTEVEIAEMLFLSKYTVHTHRKNIMKKLKLRGTVELVRFAYENELL